MDVTEVDIPIFLHPHLFWLFERKNNLKRYQLQCDLTKEYEYALPFQRTFAVGEFVAAKRGKIWCRAIIEDIIEDGSYKFEVWLIDYGHLYYSNLVHELNKKFRDQPALVKQASLLDVVFMDEGFSLEQSCIKHFKNSNPNVGATVIALTFLKDYTLYFRQQKEINGILFGDIFYKRDGLTSSLIKTLIEKEIMVEDKEMFSSKIEKSRIYDKDFHIHALRQASKSHSSDKCALDLSVMMHEVFMRSSPRGISLGGSYSESEPEERGPKYISPKAQLLKKLKRKSDINNETNCTESECEDASVTETASIEEMVKASPDKLEDDSRSTKLKKLKNRKLQVFNRSHENNSDNKTLTSGDEIKFMSDAESILSSVSLNNSLVEETKKEESQRPPKLLQASNTVFFPGGIRCMNKKSQKKLNSSSSYFSDSSISTDSKRAKMTKNNTDKTLLNSTGSVSSEKETEKAVGMSDPDWNDDCKKMGSQEQGSQLVVKPFCSCKQCSHWTNADDWRPSTETFSGEQKVVKLKIVRPPSLLLNGKREKMGKLLSINYQKMSIVQKQSTQKLLTHGNLLPTPIDRVAEAPFHSTIHESLKKLGYKHTEKIQSYIWPAIARSMDVCYIHRKKTGKTLAYLPPLCSFLLEREDRYDELKKGGPIATILCRSSSQCEEVYDLAHKLMEAAGHKKPKVLLVTYPFDYINMSSVDLLITIPPVLIELLKKKATNLKRLCHLVLEDVNVLLDKYSVNMNVIIGGVESMLSHRVTRHKVQLIMSGEHWTVPVEKFIKTLREIPLISIGDYLEAALYGRMSIKVKCIHSKDKIDAVIAILKDKFMFFKSIVLCNTDEEVELLKIAFQLTGMSFITITFDLPKEEILQQLDNWELATGGHYKVLICTDQILHSMLSITSASLIISYSLPDKWTRLKKRFNCLLENYKSPFISDINKLVCEGYILTDELCEGQIPRLLTLLQNFENPSEKKFEAFRKGIIQQKEEENVNNNVSLCQYLKQFGHCYQENCSKRHILSATLDTTSSLPKNGTIKFKIVELLDVNHMRVNIVQHKDIDMKITAFKSQKDLNDERLTSLLANDRKQPEEIRKGESYAYWDEEEFDDVFRECIVEEIRKEMVCILVKESGRRMMVGKTKIFNLPEELNRDSSKSQSCTDVIVANFKPPYKDDKFSARAFYKLKTFVEGLGYDDNLFVANICLQLGNTLWITNVIEEVSVYDMHLMKTNLSKELVKMNLAEANKDHMKVLYDLCEEAGIGLPKYIVPVAKRVLEDAPQEVPQWAFLDMENISKVNFSSAVAPDEIYVRLEKFASLLSNLDKDIADVVRRQGSKRDFPITAGRYYLAKYPEDDKFARVLIKRIEDGQALCFAVDYGDESVVNLEDIRYLPNQLITKLPFQAIQCRMHGLRAIDAEWPAEAVDVLYEKFALETDSDIFRTLYVKCVYSEKGIFRGQSKFSVLFKDVYDDKPIIINQLLVDCGWADICPNADLNDFEIPVEKQDVDEEVDIDKGDEEWKEVEDIFNTTKLMESNNCVLKTEQQMDFEEMEGFFGEPEEEMEQFENFMNELMRGIEEKQAAASSFFQRSLPAIEAAPFEVDYLTPYVDWNQTNEQIRMYIKLPNVQDYKVKLDKSRIFTFQTTLNEKKYCLKMLLYEMVEKDFQHMLGGLEVKIVLNKKEHVEWPRLPRNSKRLRNVRYRFDEGEKEEEKKKLFLDLGEEFKDDPIKNGEETTYMVVSDLDSDYDMSLEEDSDY